MKQSFPSLQQKANFFYTRAREGVGGWVEVVQSKSPLFLFEAPLTLKPCFHLLAIAIINTATRACKGRGSKIIEKRTQLMEDTKQIFCAKIWLRGVGSESKCWDWEITCARNAIEMAIKWWRCKKREWGWEGGKLWPPNMFAGEPRKLNSTLQRNTFYSVGQNPCLTYWEIGGNVCPVNIGDVEAAGDIKRGGLTARKEPPLRLSR